MACASVDPVVIAMSVMTRLVAASFMCRHFTIHVTQHLPCQQKGTLEYWHFLQD
jgi:hypothetical protein